MEEGKGKEKREGESPFIETRLYMACKAASII
jgi:hypothetical protein